MKDMRPSKEKTSFNFYFQQALLGKDQTMPTPKDRYLLMHPLDMESLQLFKGSVVLLYTENGQLLFRCWPCSALQLSAIVLPSLKYYNYSKGPVFCTPYHSYIGAADLIVLNCDDAKHFMKTESFKKFVKNQLDHVYLREGLILNISYLGYPYCLTVKKIDSEDVDEVTSQESLFDICKNISSINISEDNFESSVDETSFICSTPISSKQSSNHRSLPAKENRIIHKPQKFYSLHTETKIVLQNSNEENIYLSNQMTLQHLSGLEKQISEMKSLVQSFLNQDSLCKKECYGIVLVGASGTGKSALVQAVGNEFNLPIFRLNSISSDRDEDQCKYELKKLFDEALDNSPSILFIDNIDKLSKSGESKLVHFLSSMINDFLRSVNRVLIIGAAQNISAVDESLRKCGNLEKEIYFGIPTAVSRKEVLGMILKLKIHNLTDSQIKEISEITHGFTGGDLKLLCDKADISSCERKYYTQACITLEDLKEALRNVKPSSMAEFVLEVPNVKWTDIGGMQAVKTAVTEMVDWPLNHLEQFKQFGITPSRGILMYGPPGCSKTMIAKALVSESHLNFISIKGPQLFNKYVGESEKAVSELFKKARSAAPCVLFFDEIDSLTSVRGSTAGNSNVAERILTQLLVEIDGIDVLQGVSIIAATNRPDMIDPSFLRPGRFDRMIYVPLPDSATRKEIFEAKLKNMPHASDIDLSYLVEATDGYTGAEITDVCREAAMSVIKDYITSKSSVVSMYHFLIALKSVVPRTSKEMIQFYENYCKRNF